MTYINMGEPGNIKKYIQKIKTISKDPGTKGALFWGSIITLSLIFLWCIGDTNNKSVRIRTYTWPWFIKAGVTIPSLLIFIYGIKPESKVGKHGKIVYEFFYNIYLWYRKNK